MIENKKYLKSSRDEQIDSLRGIAILLVILGHSIQYSGIDNETNIVFRVIYAFHMPLFMFISGYVSFFSKEKGFSSLRKKMIMLLVPFTSWGIVSFFKGIYEHKFYWSNFVDFLINLLLHPDDNGLWFLWVLFLVNILVFIVELLNSNREIGLLGFWVLLNLMFLIFPNVNYFGLALLKYHLFYYFLGLVFYRTKIQFASFYSILINTSWLFFSLMVFFWYRLLPPSFILNLQLSKILTKILWLCYQYSSAIFGIASSLLIVKLLFHFRIRKTVLLNQFGTKTLELYAVHFYILGIWFYVFRSIEDVLRIGLVFIFTILSTWLVILLMKKSKIIALLFFGQLDKKNVK